MTRKAPQSMNTLGDDFYRAIGYCITDWARLDEEIFSIFRHCVGPLLQCAIIYYRIPGLDIRLGLADELVKSVLPKPARKSGGHPHHLVTEWENISKQIRDQLSVRRRIAHQPVMVQSKITRSSAFNTAAFNEVPFNSPGEIESWFAIYTNQHERLRDKESNVGDLTFGDLETHHRAIQNVTARANAFKQNLRTELPAGPPPQDRAQS